MIDVNARKELFKEYAACMWMKVTKEGKIARSSRIDISYVRIDKDGNVYVEWHDNKYSTALKTARVNAVDQAEIGYCIRGVFTSEDEAKAAAKEWFNEERRERIEQLEKELAELKKECNEN